MEDDAARPPLPSQKLLQQLQHTQALRQERFAATVGGKLRGLLASSDLHAQHAVKSDEALCARPDASVHALLSDVQPVQSDLQLIKSMLTSKEALHQAAWQAYAARRDAAAAAQHHTVAGHVAQLKALLAESDAQIERRMELLDASRVMVLDSSGLQQVWEDVAAQGVPRATAIDALGERIAAADAACSSGIEAALSTLVSEAMEVAHLDGGQVTRLVEEEALAHNLRTLDNRKAAVELLQRLHTREVGLAAQRRAAWESGQNAWQRLRTRHAVACLCERLTSAEFSDPPSRQAVFASLQASQQQALGALARHIAGLPALLPPNMSAEGVAQWCAAAAGLDTAWQQQVGSCLAQLREVEVATEAGAQQALRDLEAELATYERAEQGAEGAMLVASEAVPLLSTRRETALQLIQCTEAFLQHQAQVWQRQSTLLGEWLSRLAAAHEHGRRVADQQDARARDAVDQAKQQFDCSSAEAEAAMAAAVSALSQAGSQRELDECVAAALACLEGIASNYRQHHADVCAVTRAHPASVRRHNEAHANALCRMLRLAPPHADVPEEVAAGAHAEQPTSVASAVRATAAGRKARRSSIAGDGTPRARARRSSTAAEDAPPEASPAQCAEQPAALPQPLLSLLEVPGGAQYGVVQDLLQWLVDTDLGARKTAARKQLHAAKAAQETAAGAAAVEAAAAGSAASAGAAAAAKPAAAAAAAGKVGAPAPKAGGGRASATAASEAAAAAAAAAAAEQAAAEEEGAVLAMACPAAPPCPLSPVGAPLCSLQALPESMLRSALKKLQLGMLADAEAFACQALGAAEEWAASHAAAATASLDGQLRAHRPRAGRVEEAMHAARAGELVAQRRRLEGLVRCQGHAVEAQQAAFQLGLGELSKRGVAWVAGLQGTARRLAAAVSCKGIDICCREAQASCQRSEKALAAAVEALRTQVEGGCADIVASNRRFDAEHLKLFEEGGRYAAGSVASAKQQLASIDGYLATQQVAQLAAADQLADEVAAKLSAALAEVKALVPSHHQDMTLIEATDRALEAARRQARSCLEASSEAAATIEGELQQLEGLLVAPPAASASAPKLSASVAAAGPSQAARSHRGSAAAGRMESSGEHGKQRCLALLCCCASLRQKLLAQAQGLECLQSSGMPQGIIGVVLEEELAASCSSASQKAVVTAAGTQPAAGISQAAAPKVAPPAASPLVLETSLAKAIQGAITKCKEDVAAAAKTYYAAKEPGRPIRYPARLPAAAEQLLSATDAAMASLKQDLAAHMEAGAQQLRHQAVRAMRLLEALPAAAASALMHHHIDASSQQHQQLAATLAAERAVSVAQVERIKRSLHPGMLAEGRRQELQQLREQETARAADAAALTARAGGELLGLVQKHAQQLDGALRELTQLLLVLLDGITLPGDLLPGPLPAAATGAGGQLQRRGLRQLQQLAKAHEGAAPSSSVPAGGGAAAPAAGRPAAAKTDTAKPLGKPLAAGASTAGRPGTAGKAAAAAVATAGDVAPEPSLLPRPYALATWQLPACPKELHVLGWSAEDSAAVAAAAALEASAGRPAAAAAPAAAEVSALDTPCQRACILAHKASVRELEQHMLGLVAQHRVRLLGWVAQERAWSMTWAALLAELDGAV